MSEIIHTVMKDLEQKIEKKIEQCKNYIENLKVFAKSQYQTRRINSYAF